MVDDEDFEYLNQWKWFYDGLYASRMIGRSRIRMHRVIMKTVEGMETDHINHNSLDNRKENLRICTHAENLRNQNIQTKSRSGFKGVRFHTLHKKWIAQIKINQKVKYLGLFSTSEKAALAYDQAAKKYFREFAHLNFPEIEMGLR